MMTPEALEALKLSIKHWEENVAAEEPMAASVGANDCHLCHLYHPALAEIKPDTICGGCPVSEATKQPGCNWSPYGDAKEAYAIWQIECDDVMRDEWRTAAQAELDFLRSLLPAGDA